MAFESGVVPQDWRSAVIVSLYKSKKERTEYRNYKGIILVRAFGKINAGILADRVREVTESMSKGVSERGRGV